MKLFELTTKVSKKMSLPRKFVNDVVISVLDEIKDSIESCSEEEVIFQSPLFSIKRKIFPQNESNDLPESKRKRGIILINQIQED